MPKRTKKGGAANNTKVKEYSDKINNYIRYCDRLKILYDKKHEEVRTLTKYLIQIERDFPNVPVTHQIVSDIINAISSLPEINIKQQELTDLDKIQDNLMKQAHDNRNNIYRKINKLRATSGQKPVVQPRDGPFVYTGPLPPAGPTGNTGPVPPLDNLSVLHHLLDLYFLVMYLFQRKLHLKIYSTKLFLIWKERSI